MPMAQAKPHFQALKDRWMKRHQETHATLWNKHRPALVWIKNNTKKFALGSTAGLLMLAQPSNIVPFSPTLSPVPTPGKQVVHSTENLLNELRTILPENVGPLNIDQKFRIENLLTTYFGFPIVAEFDGKSLNRVYGIIGAEQHLMRYSGDTMETHFASEEEKKYWSSGMAPGRGAWGYFAPSRAEMTAQDISREKYYIAVQTFLAPGWQEHSAELSAFFKYRKMLVLNPDNGKAVVAVIGDAGPAEWTGKQLGGSPEVMSYLERQDGAAKGAVLYFFINDPENKIPLGPINLNNL